MPHFWAPTPLCSSRCKISRGEIRSKDRFGMDTRQGILMCLETRRHQCMCAACEWNDNTLPSYLKHPLGFSGINFTPHFSQSTHWLPAWSINNSCLVLGTLSSDTSWHIIQLSYRHLRGFSRSGWDREPNIVALKML